MKQSCQNGISLRGKGILREYPFPQRILRISFPRRAENPLSGKGDFYETASRSHVPWSTPCRYYFMIKGHIFTKWGQKGTLRVLLWKDNFMDIEKSTV